jgi:O-antigen/teichoic acid export membrane protein
MKKLIPAVIIIIFCSIISPAQYLKQNKSFFEKYYDSTNKSINENLNYHPPELPKMGLEVLVGTGIGLGIGMVGAMFGSFGHIVGDTSSKNSDDVASVELIIFCIGHALGSIGGTIYATEKYDGFGSPAAVITGSILGEAAGLYLLLKNKNISTGIFYVFSASLIGTLSYSIFRNHDKKIKQETSLINYGNGNLSFGFPDFNFSLSEITKKLNTNLKLLRINL